MYRSLTGEETPATSLLDAQLETVDDFLAEAEALFREARRRQRRRRMAVAVALLLVGVTLAYFVGAGTSSTNHSTAHSSAVPASAPSQLLTIRLRGFGAPQPTTIDSSPCPQGRTLIPVVSVDGRSVGKDSECVLTIRKAEEPGSGIRSIRETTVERYALPAGSIETRESHVVRFARDQSGTAMSIRGRIIGGTGRHRRARGTLTGGGPGFSGNALWTISIHLRSQ